MIQLQINPLERLGISREIVRRFCAGNGVGLKDLGRLVQTVSRHASIPFHTDINKTPQAEKIFTDIQQAASEVDTEEMLQNASADYLDRPADQIAKMRAELNSRLTLIQNQEQELKPHLDSILLGFSLGNDLFEEPALRIKRFCASLPNLKRLAEGGYVNFYKIFYDEKNKECEYFVNDDSSLTRFNLVRYKEPVLEDSVNKYIPKPDELILAQVEPLSEGMSDPTCEQINVYHHYFRDGEVQKLKGLKIIGSLHFGDMFVNNITMVLCNHFSLPYQDPVLPTEDLRYLYGAKIDKPGKISEIRKELEEGFSTERFKPLLEYFSPNLRFGNIIVAYETKGSKARFILLGANNPLHPKTPGLYKED